MFSFCLVLFVFVVNVFFFLCIWQLCSTSFRQSWKSLVKTVDMAWDRNPHKLCKSILGTIDLILFSSSLRRIFFQDILWLHAILFRRFYLWPYLSQKKFVVFVFMTIREEKLLFRHRKKISDKEKVCGIKTWKKNYRRNLIRFLGAEKHLHKKVCTSIRPFFQPSVGPVVHYAFSFCAISECFETPRGQHCLFRCYEAPL